MYGKNKHVPDTLTKRKYLKQIAIAYLFRHAEYSFELKAHYLNIIKSYKKEYKKSTSNFLTEDTEYLHIYQAITSNS